jgi:hypothetical protein
MAETLGKLLDRLGVSDSDDKSAYLPDGVYDASGLEHLVLDRMELSQAVVGEENRKAVESVEAFVSKHGAANVTVGAAYETYSIILLSGRPVPLWKDDGRHGDGEFLETSGFNYGTTSLLDFTKLPRRPDKILILAQND